MISFSQAEVPFLQLSDSHSYVFNGLEKDVSDKLVNLENVGLRPSKRRWPRKKAQHKL